MFVLPVRVFAETPEWGGRCCHALWVWLVRYCWVERHHSIRFEETGTNRDGWLTLRSARVDPSHALNVITALRLRSNLSRNDARGFASHRPIYCTQAVSGRTHQQNTCISVRPSAKQARHTYFQSRFLFLFIVDRSWNCG